MPSEEIAFVLRAILHSLVELFHRLFKLILVAGPRFNKQVLEFAHAFPETRGLPAVRQLLEQTVRR